MDKKFHETFNLSVEIMNSRRQVKEKLGHVVQLNVNLMLILFNLSFVNSFTLRYCKRVVISLVEVFERVRKSLISVGKG